MIQINETDFERFQTQNSIESYTAEQMNAWITENEETLKKSELDELNDIEKADVDAFNNELASFTPIEILSNSKDLLHPGIIRKSLFIRELQVNMDVDIIEKSEDGEDKIEKARTGIYRDTHMNRKMGRVGQKFGKEKDE